MIIIYVRVNGDFVHTKCKKKKHRHCSTDTGSNINKQKIKKKDFILSEDECPNGAS